MMLQYALVLKELLRLIVLKKIYLGGGEVVQERGSSKTRYYFSQKYNLYVHSIML